jgi:hypothetical protein
MGNYGVVIFRGTFIYSVVFFYKVNFGAKSHYSSVIFAMHLFFILVPNPSQTILIHSVMIRSRKLVADPIQQGLVHLWILIRLKVQLGSATAATLILSTTFVKIKYARTYKKFNFRIL